MGILQGRGQLNMEQRDDTRDHLIMILTSPAHMSLQLSVADIDDDTSLVDDLGLDSIQLLEFSMAIEDEFKINIAESIERSTLDRFANLVTLVREARASAVVSSQVEG
jgi:acyl carrier protein